MQDNSMKDNSIYLHPLTVNHLEYSLQPHAKKNIILYVESGFSFQEISSSWVSSDWQCAILKCSLIIKPKKEDCFRLKMEVSAVFECNMRSIEKYYNSDFKSVIQEAGIHQFSNEIKSLVASLTKLFGYRELKI